MGVVTQAQRSFYDEVGGDDTFHAIVSRFYAAGPRGRDPAAAVPRRRSRRRRGAAADVPRAVLGRPAHLLRPAWPPAAADAPQPVQDRLHRARRLAAVHAHRGRLDRLARPSTTRTARSCWPTSRWPRSRWSTRRSEARCRDCTSTPGRGGRVPCSTRCIRARSATPAATASVTSTEWPRGWTTSRRSESTRSG